MGLLSLRTDHSAVREEPPAPLAIESGAPACPHCGTPGYTGPGVFTCYWCARPLREVADWNPTPDEWFAAVGPYLIDRAAFVPGEMGKLAAAAVQQGADWGPLFHAAAARLLPVAGHILGLDSPADE
jgi:hypothetical protein